MTAGFLVWWNIEEGAGPNRPAPLGLPSELVAAAGKKSGWTRAARNGARAVRVNTEDGTSARYDLRDIGSGLRVLFREHTDATNGEVTAYTVGVVERSLYEEVTFTPGEYYREFKAEVDAVLRSMVRECGGSRSASEIGRGLTRWARRRGAISMRGVGGIYYLPAGDGFEVESRAIQAWLPAGSEMYVVPVQAGNSAHLFYVGVVDAELSVAARAAEEKVRAWLTNDRMNDGSLRYSLASLQQALASQLQRALALQAGNPDLEFAAPGLLQATLSMVDGAMSSIRAA